MRAISLPGPSKTIIASPYYKWWAYFTVAIGLYSTVMDQTGVNIALPRIADHFALDIPTVQWIFLTYILTSSVMFMPLGRLSDIVGRKKVYIAGFLLFAGGAMLGGMAQVFPMLIASKVVQGIGSAGIQANGLAIITASFPEHERGKAIGLYTTIIGSGLISGPIIGGFLVSSLGWRAVFFANIPISFIAVLFALGVLIGTTQDQASRARRPTFDWGGAGLSAGALVGFLLGMSNGHRFGWGSAPVVTSFSLAGVLFVAFIWWQLRTSDPMLDMSFFRSKIFSMGVSARFLSFLASSSVFFLMPFYLINGLGYSPGRAGLVMVPGAICMSIAGPISGRLSQRLGTRWTTSTGVALSASAMFTFSFLTIDSSPVHVIIGLVLSGSGMGTFNSANSTAILGTQATERFGIVAAFLNLIRTSANVTGVALATTIVTVTMGSLGYEPSLAAISEVGGEGVREAFVSGLSKAFITAGSLHLMALAISGMHGVSRPSVSFSDEQAG